MDISTQIRKIMLDEKVNIVELAKRLDTSQPNVSAKLRRNNFNIKDLEKFSKALGYEIEIIFKKQKLSLAVKFHIRSNGKELSALIPYLHGLVRIFHGSFSLLDFDVTFSAAWPAVLRCPGRQPLPG